jgi:hypothetical protein
MPGLPRSLTIITNLIRRLPLSKYACHKCWHRNITNLIFDFQIASFDIQDWQTRNQEARLKDKKALDKRLDDLASNQNDLKKMFSKFFLLSYLRLIYNILFL